MVFHECLSMSGFLLDKKILLSLWIVLFVDLIKVLWPVSLCSARFAIELKSQKHFCLDYFCLKFLCIVELICTNSLETLQETVFVGYLGV